MNPLSFLNWLIGPPVDRDVFKVPDDDWNGVKFGGTITGRTHAYTPSPDAGYGVNESPSRKGLFRERVKSLPFYGTAGFDYAGLEERIAQSTRDRAEIARWMKGENPNLKVRFTVDGPHLYVWHGVACRNLGSDTSVLEKAGYRIETRHRRDYYDAVTDTDLRLRPHQVATAIPTGVKYVYENAVQSKVEFIDQKPWPWGGDTTVKIYAPSGYWAQGVAVCGQEDIFNKTTGRTLAFARAIIKLNEVVNGEPTSN